MINEQNRSTGVFSRDRRAPYLAKGLDNPILRVFLVGATLAGAVSLLVPSLHTGDPELAYDQVGAIAPRDILVPGDYIHTVVDERATAEKRELAAQAVRPVYDYSLEVKEAKLGRVQAAFALGRETLQPIVDRLKALKAPPADGQGPKGEERKKALAQAVEERAKAIDELRNRIYDELDDTLAPEEYVAMAAADFGREIEDALVYLLGEAMRYKILATSRQLEPVLASGGIDLRILRGPTVIDEVAVSTFEDFASVRQAAEKVAAKARQGLKGLPPNVRDLLVGVASRMIETNCRHNELETQRRRKKAGDEVQDLVTSNEFQEAQALVDRGHRIEARHVDIYLGAFRPGSRTDAAQVAVGLACLLLLLGLTLFRFSSGTIRKFAPEQKDVLFLGIWGLLILAGARVDAAIAPAVADTWGPMTVRAMWWLYPVAVGAMVVRLVINAETALVFSVFIAVITGLVFDGSVSYGAYALIGGVVAAGTVGHAKTRMDVLRAGLMAGLANTACVLCLILVDGSLFTVSAPSELALALCGGVVTGLLATAVTPVVESVFGYTTNVQLLELANLNNELLKDLAIRAPGTFHHSILTGTLAEAGAEVIRANPLLARVGAYYHDVGKAKCPPYFAENQKGENPHDKLKASMSALILKDHVKDGVRILKEQGYPAPIVDICEQHLGTTLIQYFHNKAKASAEEDGLPAPDESDYRYPGPKPQTREAALVFLADSVEAAAKSIPEPTHDRLKGMVHKIINMKFLDGQFEECDLTLKDLHEIAAAFTRILTGIYHHRPQYPHQREEERTRSGGRPKKESRARLPANGRSRSSDGRRPEDAPPEGAEDPQRDRPL